MSLLNALAILVCIICATSMYFEPENIHLKNYRKKGEDCNLVSLFYSLDFRVGLCGSGVAFNPMAQVIPQSCFSPYKWYSLQKLCVCVSVSVFLCICLYCPLSLSLYLYVCVCQYVYLSLPLCVCMYVLCVCVYMCVFLSFSLLLPSPSSLSLSEPVRVCVKGWNPGSYTR